MLINKFNDYLATLSVTDICLVMNIFISIFISTCLFLTIYLTGLNKLNAKINSAEMTLNMNKDSSSSNTQQSFIPLIVLRKLD